MSQWTIFLLAMIKKTLASYSLSGHPIKFCKVMWQLTYKKT